MVPDAPPGQGSEALPKGEPTSSASPPAAHLTLPSFADPERQHQKLH